MIIVMDLETTGLIKGNNFLPGITQIGAVKYDAELNEIDSYVQDINPEIPASDWQEGAIKLRGIGPGDLDHCPTFFAAFFGFAEFVRGSVIWSGFNIDNFDTKVLGRSLERYGFSQHFPWPSYHIDIMKVVMKEYGGRRKLGDVYSDLFGEKIVDAHEALPYIRATMRIGQKLAPDLFYQTLERVELNS